MRIIFSGAQCTGKTTILNHVEKIQKEQSELLSVPYPELRQYHFYKEVVRNLMKEKNIEINERATHQTQLLILEQHYKNCLSKEYFFSDRGAIDAFVYATWSYINGKFTFAEHLEHEALFLRILPFYDHIFYFPVEFALEEDGVRSIDPVYQKEICDIYDIVFTQYEDRIKSAHSVSGSIDQRTKSIFAKLGPYLK